MARKQSKPQSMTEVLKQAIADSELSFKELERRSGVLRQCLMKFAKGEGSLRLDHADKLADFFSLELTARKAK